MIDFIYYYLLIGLFFSTTMIFALGDKCRPIDIFIGATMYPIIILMVIIDLLDKNNPNRW